MGLRVARARVRDTPWEATHWIELADILYRRGEFDLAAKAYRRVQELVSGGSAHPRGSSGAPHPAPGVDPPEPRSSPAPEGGPTPEVVATPKVPIITSATGQTRAVRLPGTNILVAVTGLTPSASSLPPPRHLRTPEEASDRPRGSVASPTTPTVSDPAPTPSPSRRRYEPGSPPDARVRTGLEQDMLRFLQIFDRPAPSEDGKKRTAKEGSREAGEATEGAEPPTSK